MQDVGFTVEGMQILDPQHFGMGLEGAGHRLIGRDQ
jgi:hypothetical protein